MTIKQEIVLIALRALAFRQRDRTLLVPMSNSILISPLRHLHSRYPSRPNDIIAIPLIRRRHFRLHYQCKIRKHNTILLKLSIIYLIYSPTVVPLDMCHHYPYLTRNFQRVQPLKRPRGVCVLLEEKRRLPPGLARRHRHILSPTRPRTRSYTSITSTRCIPPGPLLLHPVHLPHPLPLRLLLARPVDAAAASLEAGECPSSLIRRIDRLSRKARGPRRRQQTLSRDSPTISRLAAGRSGELYAAWGAIPTRTIRPCRSHEASGDARLGRRRGARLNLLADDGSGLFYCRRVAVGRELKCIRARCTTINEMIRYFAHFLLRAWACGGAELRACYGLWGPGRLSSAQSIFALTRKYNPTTFEIAPKPCLAPLHTTRLTAPPHPAPRPHLAQHPAQHIPPAALNFPSFITHDGRSAFASYASSILILFCLAKGSTLSYPCPFSPRPSRDH